MPTPLDDVCAASFPPGALAHLAALRARPDVRIASQGEQTWAFWPAGEADVARCVLALGGARLFVRREGLWHAFGQHLPTFDVPDLEKTMPLANVLFPSPLSPEEVGERCWPALPLRLVRDDRPQPATALQCSRAELGRWADGATTYQFGALEAALCGECVLLRGTRLPPLPGAERLWGNAVLLPLGWRPEPALPEGALAAALGLAEGEVALLSYEGAEVVPAGAFGPVSRAGVRLALREVAP